MERFSREGIDIDDERLSYYPQWLDEELFIAASSGGYRLDVFPHPCGATSCHALWMGVPILSLVGKISMGRVDAVLPNHVGLEAFVAHNKTEFVEKGIYWASHLNDLAKIRDELRSRFEQSAVGRPDVIAEALERALRTMWQRWCANLPAESFEVPRQEIES